MNREDFDITLGHYMNARRQKKRAKLGAAIIAIGVAVIFATLVIAAVARSDEKDVPSAARREIAMRGEQIDIVDSQVRASDDENLIAQAAETPADDSGKWHLTIVTVGNCQACEKLKSDLRADAFRDWVDVDDHAASHLHLHELRYDSDIGREWARRLEKFLQRKVAEFPTIIVQPPVNGQFGKHTQIAFMQSGYDGDPDKLTATMARDLGKYLEKFSAQRMLAKRDGLVQEDAEELEATPPPFLIAPTDPPATPGLNFPTTIIPPRVAATVEQIKAACPGCSADFIVSQISKQATIEDALAAWAKVQAPVPAVSWTTLIVSVLSAFLGGGGFFSLIPIGLKLYRSYRESTGKGTLLTQDQFDKLILLVEKIQPKPPAPPVS